jgi:indolepyruvate ferredoxin oxidoreductase alpha subunit
VSDTQPLLMLSGNEAVAFGAWQAGCSLGAAYPGTPSSEILPALAHWASTRGGRVHLEWSVNEKVALEVAAGASLTGARALAAMKHVGLNVAADPFYTLAYTGVEGGLVIVSADDPGLHSSQNEQDNRYYAQHAGVPMLEPADSQEACDYARLAFELSERFDLPVLLRTTTRTSHSRTPVAADGAREEREPGPARVAACKYVMIPAHARPRHEQRMERLANVAEWAETAYVNRLEEGTGPVGFVTAGVAYEYLREALPGAPVLKLGMPYPLPRELVARFAREVERVIVVEELEPFLHAQLRSLGVEAERLPDSFRVGELTPVRVADGLRQLGVEVEGLHGTRGALPPIAPLPPRRPVLCPGCGHRAVFAVLAEMGAFVTGDIGCYTLAALEPLAALHTCLAMGAGISQAHGIAKAGDGRQPVVAVIGDSTFTHMGLPALLNAVYNRSRIAVLILDNRTTAMTGGQEHPGTGRTFAGEPTCRLDFAGLARALGVESVAEVPATGTEAVRDALKGALAHDGPSVVVASSPCPLRYGIRATPYRVDRSECAACGVCWRVGCPAMAMGRDGEGIPEIAPDACRGCGLCAQLCPSGAIVPMEEAAEA